MMNEEPRKWVCWEIFGAGERDRRVVVNPLQPVRTAEEAAEAAAEQLDGAEARREDSVCNFHNSIHVIEVEGEPEHLRFLVTCRARLEYEALAVKEKQKP